MNCRYSPRTCQEKPTTLAYMSVTVCFRHALSVCAVTTHCTFGKLTSKMAPLSLNMCWSFPWRQGRNQCGPHNLIRHCDLPCHFDLLDVLLLGNLLQNYISCHDATACHWSYTVNKLLFHLSDTPVCY